VKDGLSIHTFVSLHEGSAHVLTILIL